MTDSSDSRMAAFERVVVASAHLSPEERDALRAWESKHVTGDGSNGTSDWPGWQRVFDRIGH